MNLSIGKKINEDIEKLTKRCVACQELHDQNSKEPMIMTEVPSEACTVLGTDLFDVKGRTFIILSDYYSKYPIVKELQAPVTSAAVADVIEDACAMFGRPDQIRSDNGPQYAGQHFLNFRRRWGIQHVTSSPHYAQSNGFSERQVRWIKSIIKKCIKTSESIPQALLHVRATPIDAKLPSPAQILMRRQITTCLPSHLYDLPEESIKARLEERSEAMKRHYDRNAMEDDLPPLYPGHNVRVLDKPSKTWYQGTVTQMCEEPRSYIITIAGGSKVRRNRRHLRETIETTGNISDGAFCDNMLPRSDTATSTAGRRDDSSAENEEGEEGVLCEESKSQEETRTTRSGRVVKMSVRYQE